MPRNAGIIAAAGGAVAAAGGATEDAFWAEIVRDQISESSGGQHTFTAAGQVGTPRAGLFFRNFAAVDGTLTDRGACNIGGWAYNGISTSQFSAANMLHHSAPGANPGGNGCQLSFTSCAGLGRFISAAWVRQKELSISSRAAGAVTCDITSDEGFTETPFATAVLLGGTALRCAAGNGAIPTTGNGVLTVTCTDSTGDFVPDQIILVSTMRGSSVNCGLMVGFCSINGSAYDQCSTFFVLTNDGTNYLINRILQTAKAMVATTNTGGAVDGTWTAAPRVATSNGFTLTKNSVGSSQVTGNVGWLALKGAAGKAFQFAMPSTATDNVDIDTSSSVSSKLALLLATMLPTVDVISDDTLPDGYSMSVSAIKAASQVSTGYASRKARDNVHNAQSISDNQAINEPYFDGTNYGTAYGATFDSFPSAGVLRLDYGTVNAASTARQAMLLLLG